MHGHVLRFFLFPSLFMDKFMGTYIHEIIIDGCNWAIYIDTYIHKTQHIYLCMHALVRAYINRLAYLCMNTYAFVILFILNLLCVCWPGQSRTLWGWATKVIHILDGKLDSSNPSSWRISRVWLVQLYSIPSINWCIFLCKHMYIYRHAYVHI